MVDHVCQSLLPSLPPSFLPFFLLLTILELTNLLVLQTRMEVYLTPNHYLDLFWIHFLLTTTIFLSFGNVMTDDGLFCFYDFLTMPLTFHFLLSRNCLYGFVFRSVFYDGYFVLHFCMGHR